MDLPEAVLLPELAGGHPYALGPRLFYASGPGQMNL